MAFNKAELSLMAYNGMEAGNHFWFYLNSEEDTVTAANFFNDLLGSGDDGKPRITNGDLMYVVTDSMLISLEITGEVGSETIETTVIAEPAPD